MPVPSSPFNVQASDVGTLPSLCFGLLGTSPRDLCEDSQFVELQLLHLGSTLHDSGQEGLRVEHIGDVGNSGDLGGLLCPCGELSRSIKKVFNPGP